MNTETTDLLLIGGGIMSTTLATLVSQLDPSRRIVLVEQDEQLASESSDGWNNAGTGHAGYCELNYTPRDPTGEVQIARALDINARFELSLQFWSSLVRAGALPAEENFIQRVPHLSWVQGEAPVDFLRARHRALAKHPLFAGMEYSDDGRELRDWMPLVMGQRVPQTPTAATRVDHGTDVDFGALSRGLGDHLAQQDNLSLCLNTRVTRLARQGDGWEVRVRDLKTGEARCYQSRFVFIGAGGAALPLLQQARLPEARGYGGFPVSGLWLACEREDLARRHHAKVYGLAPVGAPPMSVPHLDTRVFNGKPALLFGPFAGFTTRFLKQGARSDLVRSIRADNLRPMMDVGLSQWPLTRYLIREALSPFEARLKQLRTFLPDAGEDDWKLRWAGQRVQIIKPDARGRGKLEFGTEVVTAKDGSLAALLGASPGASTSVAAMLDVLERCIPELTQGSARARLQELIPSYGQSLIEDASLLRDVRGYTLSTLGLKTRRSPEAAGLKQTGAA